MTNLNISLPPQTENNDFNNWINQTTQYLRDYLGNYEYCIFAENYGFLPSATGAVNASALATAIATGTKILVVKTPGNYTLDNTSPILLSNDNMTFELGDGVNILPTANTSKVFSITGKNVTFRGGIISGDGNFVNTGSSSGRPISFIEVYNGSSPTTAQNVKIQNVKLVNPNNSGITLYRTVGVEITGCNIITSYSSASVDRALGVYVYSSAQILIEGNFIDGGSEGIVGGGEDTGGYTFNDFAGITASKDSRNIIISDNRIINYRDHGVYFSSNCYCINVVNNHIVTYITGASAGVKLAGSGIVEGNEIVSLLSGIQGRNAYELKISNNKVTITGTSTSAAIIDLDGSATYDQHLENISITGNILRSTNASGIAYGIYAYGLKRASDGSQNLIKKLTISDNQLFGTIGGVSGGSYNSVIYLLIQEHNTAASSVYGEDISICNNIAKLDPITGAVYDCLHFIKMSSETGHSNFDRVVIVGNECYGFKDDAMRLGIKNGIVDNNVMIPQTGYGAIKEITEAHTPSGLNYLGNVMGGTWSVFAAVETSTIFQKDTFYDGALGGNTVYSSYRPYRNIVFNPTANRAITLESGAGYVFTIGTLVTVHNLNGTYTLTFELVSGGGTSTIAINSSSTFMCTGSGTFIKI